MLESWTFRRLDELGDKKRPVLKAGPFGSAITKASYVEAGYKVYGQQEVASGNVNAERYYISPKIFSNLISCAVEAGDILITMMGTVGRLFVLPPGAEPGIINPRLMRISLDKSIADPAFVSAFLGSSKIQRLLERRAHGGTMPGLNADALGSLNIPVPPLPEQRKIAAILRSWDEAIEKLEALRAAKERRLAGVVQRLLAPSRAIGGAIARSNWLPSNFGAVFQERLDKNAGLGASDVITVGKYAIRKQSEHFTRSVASKDLSNYWTISPGDFVYDPMSVYYGAIGRFGGSSDGIVSPAYRVIRLRPGVDPDFMMALLRTHHIRFLLDARSSQGNREGKRRLLQREEFENIEFKLPPLDQQREIAATLRVMQVDLDLTDHRIEILTRQKRGLMQKLLTGTWRVKV